MKNAVQLGLLLLIPPLAGFAMGAFNNPTGFTASVLTAIAVTLIVSYLSVRHGGAPAHVIIASAFGGAAAIGLGLRFGLALWQRLQDDVTFVVIHPVLPQAAFVLMGAACFAIVAALGSLIGSVVAQRASSS